MSLRLAGFGVTERDVLDLYYLTAGGPDDGATIEATISAAREHGLAGFHVSPANLEIALPELKVLGIDTPGPHTVLAAGGVWWSWGQPYQPWGAQVEEAWELRWELD